MMMKMNLAVLFTLMVPFAHAAVGSGDHNNNNNNSINAGEQFLSSLLSAASSSESSSSSSSEKSHPTLDPTVFHQSLETLQKIFQEDTTQNRRSNHSRNLQDFPDGLPPPFVPTRRCGEIFGTVRVEDVATLADVYLLTLFPPGSENEALAGFARDQLLSQVSYDITLAKVCMSCDEARTLLSSSQATNSQAKYGFANYCSDGMFGADGVQQSALLMIPQEPGTENFILGEIRGSISIRGTTPDLYSSPSALFPDDLTTYLVEEPLDVVLPAMSNFLVSIVYAASGAIVAMPDMVGYGESYETPRAYFSGYNFAQGTTLAWLAAQQFVFERTGGCTILEPTATVNGYSEGGSAAVFGALALREIGVTIHSAYVGGAVYQPSLQFAYIFEVFAPDAPPIDESDLISWKIFLPMIGYSVSINNNFFPNSGTGQIMLSEAYSTGDFQTNVYDWFNPPGQLTVGSAFIQFAPDTTADVLNQALRALYDEARAIGVDPDACGSLVDTTNSTNFLCEAIQSMDLMSDLTNLVNFPMITCHSPDDTLVTYSQVPTFPFEANPLVTQFTGIPGVIPVMGSHAAATILCAVSPMIALADPGPTSPINIVELQNANECQGRTPSPAPPEDTPTSTPTDAPTPPSGSLCTFVNGGHIIVGATALFASIVALTI